MIVVTGASDGLGLEIARVYKNSSATVVNISRRNCEVADYNLLHDLSELGQVQKIVDELASLNGPIEVMINCAGIWTEEPIGEITQAELERAMALNAEATIMFTSALLERFKQDGTDILNVISTAGTKPNKSHAAYVATKWAQRGYTLSLQEELRATGCRVISFCPGGIKTKLFEKNLGKDITEDGTSWMDPAELAVFIKQILDLPKNIEVSEIILNRKKGANA